MPAEIIIKCKGCDKLRVHHKDQLCINCFERRAYTRRNRKQVRAWLRKQRELYGRGERR